MRKFPITLNQCKRFSDWPSTELLVGLVFRKPWNGQAYGTHVNHTLVNDGWCRWYRKYAPGDTVVGG